MTRRVGVLLVAAVVLGACRTDSACGLGGSGGIDPDRDPIEFLADYSGPSFSELQDVEVDGDVVWFCSGVIGLNAYDASKPDRLRALDDIAVSLGSAQYPRCQHLALAPDGRVYVSNRGDRIQPTPFIATIDGSDPSNLREVQAQRMDDEIEGLTVHGPHLLAAAHGGGLLVLDRSDLTVVARLTDGLSNAWQVRMAGSVAWVADGEAGLTAVDLSDPLSPTVLSTVALGGQAKDLEIEEGRAWVALGSAGVAVVDIEDPSRPALLDVADTPGSALGVALSPATDGLVVADWNDLRVFDVSDRDRLIPRGHEPLLLRSDLQSRTLGVATGRRDLLFSSNWTALSSYRYHPSNRSGDLDASPSAILFPRTGPGDTSNALLTLRNAGSRPLEIDGAQVRGREVEVALDPVTLAPGASHTARVSWSPSSDGPLSGWFNLLSDDADEPKKCVAVTGNLPGLGIGDQAPDASFVGLQGQVIRTRDFRGQVVMLAYFATF